MAWPCLDIYIKPTDKRLHLQTVKYRKSIQKNDVFLLPCVVLCALCIEPRTQIGVARACERLASLIITPFVAEHVSIGWFLDGPAAGQPDPLAAQLAVLRSVRHNAELSAPGVWRAVYLCERRMTQEAMEALRGLPEWCTQLNMEEVDWCLEPSTYKQMAECVPAHITKWWYHVDHGSELYRVLRSAMDERSKGA